jgi:hypothetical protein
VQTNSHAGITSTQQIIKVMQYAARSVTLYNIKFLPSDLRKEKETHDSCSYLKIIYE